jgi:hypothetical protein
MPQIVSPSVPSGPATITERYDALVASGAIERDPAQEGAWPCSMRWHTDSRKSSRPALVSLLLASVQGPWLNVQKS